MPIEVAQSTPIALTRSDRFDLSRAVKKIPLDRVANADLPARCQMSRVTGVHRQNAHSIAVSVCYDIMERARAGLSGRDLDAMNRSLELLGHKATEHFGNLLQMHLTAAGALHAGVSMRLAETPDDAALIRCRQKLEDSIIAMGIKAGRCKTVPDGGYHGDSRSAKLTDAMAVAKQRMLECARTIPMAGLLEDVAAAILPGPLMDSIRERQENPHLFAKGEGGADVMQVLQKQMCDDLEKILQAHIDSGGVEHLMVAILDLLKLPEYVVEGDLGHAGTPESPRDHSDLPRDLQRFIHDRNGHGGCTNINHSPTNIDFSEFGKALERAQLPLQELFNLFDRSRADAYELGRLTEIVRHQDQRIDKQDQYIDKLERMLNESQQRYQTFANGAGGARVSRGTQAPPDVRDQGTSTSDLPPQNDQVGPKQPAGPVPDEPESPLSPRGVNAGNGNGVVRADQETQIKQRNQLDERNQLDQRNENTRNSQNGEGDQHLRRDLDSQGNQKHTRTLGNQSNQNEQADRHIHNASGNQLSPDGRLDDIAHPDAQQQRGRQLQGRDETDHSNNRLQRQQRLGGGQQRLQRQVQNNATGNAGQNDDGTPVVGELVHYLQSFGIEGNYQPRARVQPMGPRNLSQHDVDGHSTGLSDTRTLLPSDFSGWRNDLADMTDSPFVPFRSGPVGKPSTRPLDEFEALIQRYGQGNVKPKHAMDRAGRSPALPTPMVIREPASELIQAFDAFRSRKMTPPTPSASPAPLSVPARPIHPAAESTRRVEERSRLDSLSSVSSVSSRASSLRDEIIIGSRSSRGELARQAFDSTQHGAAWSVELPRSDQSRAAASPLETARTSQLFTRSFSQLSLDSDDGIDADTFAQMIIKGSRVSRGEITRQQSDVALAASRAKQWERFREEFGPGWGEPASGAASSISSSEPSLSDRLDKDFPEIEPDTDIVDTAGKWKRAASAESRDSGNESPTRLAESNWILKAADAEAKPALQTQLAGVMLGLKGREARNAAERELAVSQSGAATWDPQPVARVGNRIAPGAAFMAELKQRIAQQAAS